MKNYRLFQLLLLCLFSTVASAAPRFVSFDSGDLLLNTNDLRIYVDDNDCKGVAIAARSLAADFRRVCGQEPVVTNDPGARVVVGTIGHSAAIDRLVKAKHIDKKALKDKCEKYIITAVDDQLVIAGSDRRGTIYGIYELSRQMGVSPWYYWADVPVAHHDHIYVARGTYSDGEPRVRYRGIFLNDEAPCLTTWVKNTFGTDYGDHRFYEKVFELILRLKGNFLWPAMWSWAFYADDPLNSKTADEMGVVIGTSHHEPMARNHQEWARNRAKYGAWNYQSNQAVIDQFFTEGIERAKGTEDVVTIGMRGDGDEAMSKDADTWLLERIVANQRDIIKKVTGKSAEKTPQVWALYKEVLEYYDKGMRVPDDVCILLCDDNWGNLRRVPNLQERKHPGGWGLYYHVDYVGAPRNSKWLNVTPSQNMWEQLTLAAKNGMEKLWVLNVGDLKPMEYPITLFLDMAWNPDAVTVDVVQSHTLGFCEQFFGKEQAAEAARILNRCCQLNGRITAEMLDRHTYSLATGEWRQVADEYMRLEAEALRQFMRLPENFRDTYRQIILFPVQAMGNIYQMYYAQAMNHSLYKANDPDCNLWADRVEQAFARDAELCREYNKDIAGGKWDGMMIQKHIGYTIWNDNFPADKLPKIYRLQPSQGGYLFTEKNGVVVMEAEHYNVASCAEPLSWTVIPGMGRTRSGIALMPYDQPVGDARLDYVFDANLSDSVEVRVVVKSTLDYLNKGSLEYDVVLDGGTPVTVRFNELLNEKPQNIHSIYYPTVARRVVESVVKLPVAQRTTSHTLTLRPLDPAIVFEKIVVNNGGYQPSYLFMDESPHHRNP